jgi:hypothetical protein
MRGLAPHGDTGGWQRHILHLIIGALIVAVGVLGYGLSDQ